MHHAHAEQDDTKDRYPETIGHVLRQVFNERNAACYSDAAALHPSMKDMEFPPHCEGSEMPFRFAQL